MLFEHQNARDPLMAFRMLGYVVEIWRRTLREAPGARLPIVIPLVLHHSPSGWTAAIELHELVHGLERLPELARFVPSFEILLDDLASLDDAALLRRQLAPLPLVVLWLLREPAIHARGSLTPRPSEPHSTPSRAAPPRTSPRSCATFYSSPASCPTSSSATRSLALRPAWSQP